MELYWCFQKVKQKHCFQLISYFIHCTNHGDNICSIYIYKFKSLHIPRHPLEKKKSTHTLCIYIDIFKYIIYTDYTLYSSTQRTTQKRRFSNFFLTTWIRLLFAKAKKDDPEASDVPDWLQVHWRWDFQGKNAPLEMRRPCIKGIMVPRHGAGV